ncbi:MAG: glycosyltransferase, partial [Planctomycetota bacterium]
MRILTLTWEFPPVITGGLGMACYGMVKSLLRKQVEVDLVMPASQPVFFSLRNPDDADNLPIASDQTGPGSLHMSREELTKLLTNPISAYHTTKYNPISKALNISQPAIRPLSPGLGELSEILSSEDPLFRQVRSFTETALKLASKLDIDLIHAHDWLGYPAASFTETALKLASKLDIDLIHAHDWLGYPAAMILKKRLNRPFVAHIHATEFDRAGGTGNHRIHHLEYLGLDYADRVVAVSEYTANTIAEKYSIPLQKISVVHNAYSVPNSPNNHRRIFKENTVLFMGRITLQKGPDYFLEVARRVLEHNKNVRFIMAGTGDMKNRILHRAAAMGLGTRFLVAGFLDRQQVDQILSTTDIFVLPSISEPFGIAPLEAMSHGAVAIISKKAGVAEIIHNAFKIDFWDIDQMVSTILDLTDNHEKLKEMSIRSRNEVSNLEWDQA